MVINISETVNHPSSLIMSAEERQPEEAEGRIEDKVEEEKERIGKKSLDTPKVFSEEIPGWL